MSELDSANSDLLHALEQRTNGGGGGADDPPVGLGEWWRTPSSLLRTPVAVDPAIYGIEPSDVGVEPSERIASAIRNNVTTMGLSAYVGMEAAASAQGQGAAPAQAAGPQPLTRADHMRSSEMARASAFDAQLLLAARNIEAAIEQIHQLLQTPLGARSPDGLFARLEVLVSEAVSERDRIMLVVHEQQRVSLKAAAKTSGLVHIDRASHQLTDAVLKVRSFASRNNVPFDAKKVTGAGVSDDVGRLMDVMHAEVESAHAPRLTASERELQLDALKAALETLDESTQALVLAVNESNPEQKIKEVMPGVLSGLRLLEAGLVEELRPRPEMLKVGQRIKMAISKAWTDAGPFHLHEDSSLKKAHDDIPKAIAKLETLAKGRKT